MSEIRFEDTTDEFGRPPEQAAGFDFTGLLIKWGIASSRQQAEYILIAVGVFCLLVIAYTFWGDDSRSPVQILPVPDTNQRVTDSS